MSRRLAVLLATSLAVALLGSPGLAETWEEALPGAPGGMVEVEFDLGEGLRPDPGSLTLRSHQVDEVRVEVLSDGWGSWNVEPKLEERAGRTRIEIRVTGASSWMFGGPNVRVRIWVPEKTSVDVRSKGTPVRIEDLIGAVRLRTEDGGAEIRGIEGPVKLRVQDGDVEIEEINGDLDVSCSDGGIRATWVSGNVEARSTNGGIQLEHVGGHAVAKTLSGDIEVSEAAGPVEARTEDGQLAVSFVGAPAGSLVAEKGNIDVQLPTDTDADLDAAVTRGKVEIAEGLAANLELTENRAEGALGKGGPRLLIRSSRGWIRVHGR
ncbi:MAG: hypothetical protein JRH01_24980 [Deltaproteobacteria bacterium]|nr:hypothetical protein [Deltaproteobacteria bacterium]MBW2397161.1 hypothetical protein [Deltaproteobacteria bacterium]